MTVAGRFVKPGFFPTAIRRDDYREPEFWLSLRRDDRPVPLRTGRSTRRRGRRRPTRGNAVTEREFCKVERDGHVTLVTIDRPGVYNALHPPAHDELDSVFDEFAADPDQWVAIVTGAGDKAFSAGNDLKYQAAGGKRWQSTHGFGGITFRYDLDKPVIAAVNGVAMGGGFEIALACDLIIAAENAVFALPEPRVGLAALAGGLQRLPRQIGSKRALGMILTGRRVSAAEGYELGFVNEVVPEGEVVAGARRWAELILECSPMSIRASKQVVRDSLDIADLATAMDSTRYPAVTDMVGSADFVEGPKAFAEKRPPRWTGA